MKKIILVQQFENGTRRVFDDLSWGNLQTICNVEEEDFDLFFDVFEFATKQKAPITLYVNGTNWRFEVI